MLMLNQFVGQSQWVALCTCCWSGVITSSKLVPVWSIRF